MQQVSTDKEDLVHCYNKGCGAKFSLEDNNDDSCCFHSGGPIFHDAYKGWSCCNKKSTDFTTFLNMEGCTKGKHNPVKPEAPVKQKPDASSKDDIITVCAPKEINMKRPDFNATQERLKVTVSQSLRDALNTEVEKIGQCNNEDSNIIKIGEFCKNNGCQTSYEGEHSNLGICKHHPGIPIFHEGLKYWLCCQRKTTDFDVFLEQEGCTTGSHVWIKKNLTKATCRYDWHQTASFVVVTIYSKVARPDFSYFEVNPVRLKFKIAFKDNQEFSIDNELGGIIIPDESVVTMAASKVEVKLRKAEPKHWSKLLLPPLKKDEKENAQDTINQSEELGSDGLDVDAIDLNDL